MKDRLYQLRKETLNLSRAKFGEAIGMSDSEIKNVEYGNTQLKENKIALICSVYGVNEIWLRTGVGEMFKAVTRNEEISKFFYDVLKQEDESFQKRFIAALASCTPEMWDAARKFIDDLSKK